MHLLFLSIGICNVSFFYNEQIPLVLHKEPDVNERGQQMADADGRPRYRCGFRIGGGIDQDPTVSPQGYPDKVTIMLLIFTIPHFSYTVLTCLKTVTMSVCNIIKMNSLH